MASIGYARQIMDTAAAQIANRRIVVVRKAIRRWEAAHDPAHDARNGVLTMPDWRYSGPALKTSADDPHSACYAVLLVERVIETGPKLSDKSPAWWPTFWRCVVMDQYPGHLDRRALYELTRAVAAALGDCDEDKENVPGWMALQLREAEERGERRRAYDAMKKREYRSRQRQADRAEAKANTDDLTQDAA